MWIHTAIDYLKNKGFIGEASAELLKRTATDEMSHYSHYLNFSERGKEFLDIAKDRVDNWLLWGLMLSAAVGQKFTFMVAFCTTASLCFASNTLKTAVKILKALDEKWDKAFEQDKTFEQSVSRDATFFSKWLTLQGGFKLLSYAAILVLPRLPRIVDRWFPPIPVLSHFAHFIATLTRGCFTVATAIASGLLFNHIIGTRFLNQRIATGDLTDEQRRMLALPPPALEYGGHERRENVDNQPGTLWFYQGRERVKLADYEFSRTGVTLNVPKETAVNHAIQNKIVIIASRPVSVF